MSRERRDLVVNVTDSETDGRASSMFVKFRGLFKSKRRAYVELDSSVREETQPSILTNTTPIPKPVCRAVILQLHEVLRKYLDFNVSLHILTRKELLDFEDENHLRYEVGNKTEKVEFLVKKLLESPLEDVLTPFVECLQECSQNDGVKDAFTDIIEEIDCLWREEKKKHKENKTSRMLHRLCIVVACVNIAFLTIGLLITLPIVSDVALFQEQGPQLVATARNANTTMSLNHIIRKQWVSTIAMRWEKSNSHCTGNVIILPDIQCLDPQLQLSIDFLYDTNPFFALPGSSVTVTIPDLDSAKNLVVWLKKSIKEYKAYLDLQHQRQTLPCNIEEECYKTNDNLNSTITLNITESDYYYVFLVDEDGVILNPRGVNINFDYDIVSFNLTAVMKHVKMHSLKPINIYGNTTLHVITFSKWFDFNKPYCNLLSFSCKSNGFPAFVIAHAKPRGDIIFLLCICFSCPFIIACICLYIGLRRMKKK